MSDLALSGSKQIEIVDFEKGKLTGVFATFRWKVTYQSVLNNSSTIGWEVELYNTSAYAVSEGVTVRLGDGIGVTKFFGISFNNKTTVKNSITNGEKAVVLSGEIVVKHDSNGNAVNNKSEEFYCYISGHHKGNRWGKFGEISLNRIIPRFGMLSADNFNDEENPSITYTPSSLLDVSTVSKLEACISLTGLEDDIPYREIPVATGGSYTFELTDSDREVLRIGVAKGNSTTVRFYVKTYFKDGTAYGDYLIKTLTLVNYLPTLNPTVRDVNERTKYLTGNNQKFIKYISNAEFDTGAEAKKMALIAEQYVINGSKTILNTPSGIIEDVDSNTFYFSITDSRGYTTKDFIVVDFVEYIKLTSRISEAILDGNGDLSFTITGNYFNGSFGAVDNSLEFEYSIRANDGEVSWHIIQPSSVSFYENTYTAHYTITGLDYMKRYTITANVIDEAMSSQTDAVVVSATPVFEWAESDFTHNTKVYFNDDIYLAAGKNIIYDSGADNKILWKGANVLGASQSVDLIEPISKQANGIVLVFSLYRNNAAENVSINSFFVSKHEVEILRNAPHTYLMAINAGFSNIGAKYVYIDDTKITGHEGNTASGTNSGISYQNGSYVLRYVLGV